MRANQVFLPLILGLALTACGSKPTVETSVKPTARQSINLVVYSSSNAKSTRSEPYAEPTTHIVHETDRQWLLQATAGPIETKYDDPNQWWSSRELRQQAASSQRLSALQTKPVQAVQPIAKPSSTSASPPIVDRLTLYFDFDSAVLAAAERRRLTTWLGERAAESSFRVDVHGHTDAIGTNTYNDSLSLRRARAVRDELVALRVSPSRVNVFQHGEAEPAATNATANGRALNRRVHVTTQPQGTPRDR